MGKIRTFGVCGLMIGLAILAGRAQAPASPSSQALGGGGQPQGRQSQISAQEGLDRMGIVGYADHMSAQPGDAVKFMVSSQAPRYRADIVRMIQGDANPRGPGIKETVIETPANGEYSGKRQTLPLGSYVTVPDNPALRVSGSFTITAWIAPTRHDQIGRASCRERV